MEFWEKLRSGRIIEGMHEHVSGTGSPIWLQSTFLPIRDDSGFVKRILQVAMDVSDAAQRAGENELWLEAFKTQFAFAELDIEGHVRVANAEMIACYGLSEGDVLGRRFDSFCDDEFRKSDLFENAWKDTIKNKRRVQLSVRLVNSTEASQSPHGGWKLESETAPRCSKKGATS